MEKTGGSMRWRTAIQNPRAMRGKNEMRLATISQK